MFEKSKDVLDRSSHRLMGVLLDAGNALRTNDALILVLRIDLCSPNSVYTGGVLAVLLMAYEG